MRPFRAASPLVVGLGGGAAASSLLTNLAGYWKLDEASGDRADSSGNGSTLTPSSGSVSSRTGKISSGADFLGGSNPWLTCASNTNLVLGDIDWTITQWVYFDATGGSYYVSLSKDIGATVDYQIYIHPDSSFRVYMNTAGGSANLISSVSAAASTWYFVVVIHDSVNDLLKISINNGAFNSGTPPGAPTTTTGAFRIGSDGIDGTNGIIDEVGIWKRVLSSSEITQLYNGGAGLTYPF